MKKILLIVLLIYAARSMYAQNITAAEFFVDTDPGVGNATPVTVTAGTTVSFNASVPASSLSDGFHFIGIRAMDATGKWGLYETRGFYITSSTSNVTNITAAEYFIDTDPGVGNGINVPVSSGSTVPFSVVIPASSLSDGFHFIGIRTRDTQGKWGLYETRGFYITTSTSNVTNINAAEYFIDTDPGVGNGVNIPVSAGAVVPFTVIIPTTSLANGFHFIGIRSRDIAGKWGLYETRGIYISNTTANVTNITAAEFFVDTDPGVGNGTPVAITSGSTVTFSATIPTTSLASGFHFAAIRTRDAEGKWGLYETRGFYISTQTTNMPNMVAAEYFIDADPGVGNGTSISIPSSASISQNFILNVPAGTTNGQHLLAIRFRDADGRWGLFDFDTINVAGVVLPLTFLRFEAVKHQNSVSLKWKTTDEVNTSHFDVERSINGVDFVKIGVVSARNTAGVHEYQLQDVQPVKGVNLYRIKQVDLDGKFTYSRIARILFDAAVNMIVYPNPSKDRLFIDVSKPSGKWSSMIYDASGKLVRQELITNMGTTLQLDIASLAKGSYALVLNNGMETYHARFIKQ